MADETLHQDAPLTLAQATDLPELGGAFSVKQLRGAIARGDLAVERHGSRMYVTRAGIAARRERRTTFLQVEGSARTRTASEPRTPKETQTSTALQATRDAIARLRDRPERRPSTHVSPEAVR